MFYEITVCKGRKFIFATQPIETAWQTKFVYELIESKFTRAEGYRITIRQLEGAKIIAPSDLTL